ncbi:amidase [Luteimonas aquatica]|uniref:amidase n=1 Tax=Luteimonas aquatica TaxID=450364 RepID=UPI001F57B52A|nr:amidase [Luteimonas aquatica]
MSQITHDLAEGYASRDALGLAQWIRSGEVSAAEVVEIAIARIERVNPELNAVILKTYDIARRAAAEPADRDAPFAGVPFLLKDAFTPWAGLPTANTCAYLRPLVAPADSETARRIKRAGFALLGKTNVPENGWSIATEPKLTGRTRNPWREDVSAGGSSGGSAAAVAARIVPLADATDGAGSIRVPASNNGLVGLKPSRGRISYAPFVADPWYGGTYALCNSLTVRDTAAYLDAMGGGSLPGDPYSAAPPQDNWLAASSRAPGRLRIGFAGATPQGEAFHPEVQAAMRNAARLLERLGHHVEAHELSAFDADAAWMAYTGMAAVQTASMFESLAPLVGRPVTAADVEPLTWACIERGRSLSGVRHAADIEALRQIGRALVTELMPFDVYLTPTLTHPPRPHGHWDMDMTDYDAYNALWSDGVFLFPFNISGQPAMSLPLHWTDDGLPVGVQIVGRPGEERTLLQLATQLEQAQPWIDRRPPIRA